MYFSDVDEVVRRSQSGNGLDEKFNNAVANSGDGVRQVGGEDGNLVESDKKKGRVFRDPVNDESIQVMSRKIFAPQSRKKKSNGLRIYIRNGVPIELEIQGCPVVLLMQT